MKTKIALLKFIDRFIGGLVVRLLSRPRPVLQPVFRSFLVIRPGGIGDAIHLIPLLQQLHNSFPEARITLLVEKRNAAALELAPFAMTVWCYDRPAEFLQALRGHYDVVIDTEQWHYLSAIVARLVRAPRKIGFSSNERYRLFTDTLTYSQESYEAELFLSLLAPLAIYIERIPEQPWLTVPQLIAEKAALFLSGVRGRYVVIFPGASIPERCWGGERFRLLSIALQEYGWEVVVVGGRDVCATAAVICQDGVGHNFSGKMSLAETAALIAGADLLISGDSGILHIGVGLAIPTVSLFGPGIVQKWGPRGDQHTILNRQLPCSPCTLFGTTPLCPRHVECLSGLSVDAVICAVKKQLQQNGID